jgi:isopenicillin N synthase-like dioxygenase
LLGFHYDLNFITIHGKSRFPGLHIWTREGKKMAVKVPDGCLLIQAGKQLEWLTGGDITAGYHEVVCTEQTLLVNFKELFVCAMFIMPPTGC